MFFSLFSCNYFVLDDITYYYFRTYHKKREYTRIHFLINFLHFFKLLFLKFNPIVVPVLSIVVSRHSFNLPKIKFMTNAFVGIGDKNTKRFSHNARILEIEVEREKSRKRQSSFFTFHST